MKNNSVKMKTAAKARLGIGCAIIVCAGLSSHILIRNDNFKTPVDNVIAPTSSRLIKPIRQVMVPPFHKSGFENNDVESKIIGKYNDLLKSFQAQMKHMPEEVRVRLEEKLRAEARFAIENPSEYVLKKSEIPSLPKKEMRTWVSVGKLMKFLSGKENVTAKHYALAAFLAADASILEQGMDRFSNNKDLLLSSLIFNENYLQSRSQIDQLAEMMPDSPWPGVLGALNRMAANDTVGATGYLYSALRYDLVSFENQYRQEWADFESEFRIDASEGEWPPEIGGIIPKSSDALVDDIVLNALSYYKKNVGDPEISQFAATALALAERMGETDNLIGERVALMNELDLLNGFGPEVLQPYLAEPFQKAVNSIVARRYELSIQIEKESSK